MKHEYYNMKHVRNVINGKKKIAGKAEGREGNGK